MGNDPGLVREWLGRVTGRGWQSIVLVAVLLLGVTASTALFVVLTDRDQEEIREDIEQAGRERTLAIKRTLELDFLDIKATVAFFTSSNEVERREFISFVYPLLKDQPSLQAIQWAPRVHFADRLQFEEAVAHDGYPGFRIGPYDRRSLLTPTGSVQHDDCYPILYSVPTDNTAPVLGADLATNPVCLEAMDRARDTAQFAVTSKILLPDEPVDGLGVRVFVPIYQKDVGLSTVEERRKHLKGFLVAVLRLKGILTESVSALAPSGVDIRLFDSSDPRRQTLLAWHRSRLSGARNTKESPLQASDMSFSETLDVGGRRWTIVCVATPQFSALRTTWYPIAVSLSALLLTGLLTAYLVGVAAYTGRTARLATELKRTNQLLGNEVADRKRMESNLRASQTKYRTLCDSSSDAIVLMTPEGVLLAANRASLAIYGCKDELEFTSHSPASLSPEFQPDGDPSAAKAREMMAIAMKKGSHSFEWTHKRVDDGKEFCASVTLVKFDVDDRSFLQATVRDITEQKRAETNLWTTELKYKTLYESARDAISLTTSEGALISANPANVAMFGCKDELDFLSRTVSELSPEHQPDGSLSEKKACEMRALALRKGSHCFEWTHRRLDNGREFIANVTLTRMDFEDSCLLLATIRDITEQRRAEESLRASETKYRTLFDASSDAIMLRTPDRRVVAANRAAVELFRCKDESELRALDPADIYVEYQPDGMLSAEKAPLMAEAALREGAYSFEWKYKRRDGTEFLANVLWTRMELEGQTILLTTIRDITEQRQAEESLRASETKYKALFDGSGDAIMLRNPDMTVLAANAATLALFHAKDVAELSIGMPLAFSPEFQPDGTPSVDKVREMAAIVMRDGVNRFEWKYRRKDGSEFLANVLLTRIQLKDECVIQVTVRDITQQKQMEEALKASERRFRDVLHASRDAMLLLDGERFVDCNETAAKMLGYSTADECMLIHPGELSPPMQPDGRPSHEKAVEMIETAKREGFHRFEWVHRKANGEDLPVEVSLTAVVVEGKNQLISHWRDISVQKRTEEALRVSERRHRLFAENVADVIWTSDLSGRFTYISPSVEQLLGFKWDDGMQVSAADVVTPSAFGVLQKNLRRIIVAARSGRRLSFSEDMELRRIDGSTVWGEVTHSGFYDESGQLMGCLGITRDITERRRLEEQQARSLRRLEGVNQLEEELLLHGPIEKKFKKITETAVDLLDLDFCRIWVIKPSDRCEEGCAHVATSDGIPLCDRRDKCLHLVASAGRYTHIDGGHSRVPIGAYKIGRIASGENNKFLTNDVTTDPQVGDHEWARSLGLVSFAGYKLRDTDGNAIGVLAMFAKHPISEEDDAFIANLAETTSRVIMDYEVAEELRSAKEEADAANRAKSRFLANMSHEIRTPMTAILGYADLLMDPRINASNRNNYSAIIHRSGEHLLTLINDILDLSKIESGKFLLEMKQCNLVSLLADVASLMRPRAESRGVSFLVEFTGELPETVLTDGARLRQAVINLVGNAIKFTERGSVRVVTTFLRDWHGDQPAVKIEVIDTGIGIRPEVLPNLFQPFNQGDSKIAQRFGGTGLGLAISRHIAQMLGGDLDLTSVWGQGSTFTLTIPTGDLDGIAILQRPTEVEQETSGQVWRATTKDLNGVRILLAEDGYDNRELIRTVLCTAGAEVETAENGRIALEKTESGVFDVILMDMNMPEMDGYEATRNLRDRGYIGPILALTANAMAGDSAQCLAAGCNEHMAKPINRTHLIRTIARYVHRDVTADLEIPEPAKDTSLRDEGVMISEFIDDPDMAEIIAGFVGRLGGQFVAMGQAFADGQYDELRRLAHMLKGAGGSYGYPALTDACKALEDAAKAHDNSAVDAALDMVGAMIRAIENGFSLQVSTKDVR